MKTIVAALDFSDVTEEVLNHAVCMATAFEADLHLVHTIDPGPNYAMYGFAPADFPHYSMNVRLRSASNSRLQELATGTGLPEGKVHTATLIAMAVSGILQYAEDVKADLLVAGAHGHGVLGAVLLGSVAQGLVRRAELPTLIVPVGKSSISR